MHIINGLYLFGKRMLIINDVSHNTAETGRFATTTRGGTLTVTNGYNLRGWLTSIESTPFREYLYYEQPHNGSTAQYGGNISSMDWKTSDNILRSYTFQYDGLSRLTGAAYSENGSASTHYGTSYQYDLMGNITSLTRSGLQDDNSYGLIDNLSFDYNGNQLLKVTDAVTSGPNYSGAFHFNDHSDVSQEYEYDLNGNMTKDLNKKITSVEYNVLNLPEEVSINESSVGYSYAADGRKLAVHRPFKLSPLFPGLDHQYDSIAVPSPGGHGFVIIGDSSSLNPPVYDWLFPFHEPTYNGEHYCGSIIYSNNKLSTILFDGGYVTFSGSSPVYHYYLQDHLGNNCVVANESGTVEQVNHYYPYGGLMGESTGGDVQRYKYNGKELDRMHGLDWYDYGARHYDAAIGSWPTMDPLAEKYYSISPYAYCGGNPIRFVDINGMTWDNPRQAERLKRKINKRISYLHKRISNNRRKIEQGNLSERKIKKLTTKNDEFYARILYLSQSINDIDLLENDENIYSFNTISGGEHYVRKVGDIIYIETSSDALSIHEITHIRQALSVGFMEFDSMNRLKNPGTKMKGPAANNIANVEIEAYRAQYSYDTSFPGITTNLQGIDVHSVGNIVNEIGQILYPLIHALSEQIKNNIEIMERNK